MPQRILASLKSLVNKRKYLIELQFSLHKCPKPSWQGLRPPQNQANAHLILANSSLKKCPKPSGQGSRPPPPYGQCPNARDMNLSGASLSWTVIIVIVIRVIYRFDVIDISWTVIIVIVIRCHFYQHKLLFVIITMQNTIRDISMPAENCTAQGNKFDKATLMPICLPKNKG